jgi:hypothetical protein
MNKFFVLVIDWWNLIVGSGFQLAIALSENGSDGKECDSGT